MNAKQVLSAVAVFLALAGCASPTNNLSAKDSGEIVWTDVEPGWWVHTNGPYKLYVAMSNDGLLFAQAEECPQPRKIRYWTWRPGNQFSSVEQDCDGRNVALDVSFSNTDEFKNSLPLLAKFLLP